MWGSRSRRRVLAVLSAAALLPAAVAGAATVRVCVWEGADPRAAAPVRGLRGTVYLRRSGGAWMLINEIDVEEYLYGVVGNEMAREWPSEALKAQAVCSRTVAWRRMLAGGGGPYDVKNTVFFQVYGRCEDETVLRAVEETRGIVLSDGGAPAEVFFHAACGGTTAAASSVWGGAAGACARIGCPCGGASPYARWERLIPRQRLAAALGTGRIDSVAVTEADPGGRAVTVALGVAGGRTVSVSAHRLRTAVNAAAGPALFSNARTLPSTLFTCAVRGDSIAFTGKGYGHGVGLCQHGARIMAERGARYDEILAAYFPRYRLGILEQKEDHGEEDPLARSD